MHPLQHPVFRWLFAAQILSLLGIGVMTVGLALLAFEMGGVEAAGIIIGALFALKMLVYVGLAPIAEAALSRFETKRTLVSLDIFRLCVLLMFSLATEVWHLGLLAFVFYSASAAFTPLYQSIIPSVLPDEETYTSALVLSRLAYTVESMLSPLLAAVALILVTSDKLFVIAALCLAGSVLALASSGLSIGKATQYKRPFFERISRGLRIYVRTPRLRGLFVVNLGLSFGLSWVLVNTVVFTGLRFASSELYAQLMIAFGMGSAVAAFLVPQLLQKISERELMLVGSCFFGFLSLLILLPLPFSALLGLWLGLGASSSFVLTPGGLVIARSAIKADHPAVFAAQFSMSHAGWLLAYPTAGWLASRLGPEAAFAFLGMVCIVIAYIGSRIWPACDPIERVHSHPELAHDHPHLLEHASIKGGHQHSHDFYIDDLHVKWNS